MAVARSVPFAVAAMIAISACGRGAEQSGAQATSAPAPENPVVTAEKWRAKHEVDYRRDWVSIAGLYRLKQGANTAGSAQTNDIVLPAYRVVGRFIKDDQSRSLKVENTVGDIDEYKTEGVVEFTLQGQTVRLRPFTTRPNRFYFVFRDASSGHETYETARFLYADLQDDGTVVLAGEQAYAGSAPIGR